MNYKNNISILSVIIILLCGCQPDKKTTFTAASYNLRNANSADSLQGDVKLSAENPTRLK